MSPALVLGILLAISVAGNAWLFNMHSNDMVKIGTTEQLAADTKAAAESCGKSVDKLATDTVRRTDNIARMLGAESGRILDLQHQALEAARARPDNPNDLCGSLHRFLQAEIKKGRGK